MDRDETSQRLFPALLIAITVHVAAVSLLAGLQAPISAMREMLAQEYRQESDPKERKKVKREKERKKRKTIPWGENTDKRIAMNVFSHENWEKLQSRETFKSQQTAQQDKVDPDRHAKEQPKDPTPAGEKGPSKSLLNVTVGSRKLDQTIKQKAPELSVPSVLNAMRSMNLVIADPKANPETERTKNQPEPQEGRSQIDKKHDTAVPVPTPEPIRTTARLLREATVKRSNATSNPNVADRVSPFPRDTQGKAIVAKVPLPSGSVTEADTPKPSTVAQAPSNQPTNPKAGSPSAVASTASKRPTFAQRTDGVDYNLDLEKNILVQPGKVITLPGIKIAPQQFPMPPSTIVAGVPRNPTIKIIMDARGRVIHASLLKSSGNPIVDSVVIKVAYRYKGTGPILEQINKPFQLPPLTIVFGAL